MRHRHGHLPSLVVIAAIALLLAPSWPAVATPTARWVEAIRPVQPASSSAEAAAVEPASTTLLYASEDATVQSGAPDATDPDNLYLGVGYYQPVSPPPLWATGPVRSYVRFDLSTIPVTSTIASATLRLYHAGGADYDSGWTRATTFYRVSGSWSEASVTWNTKPNFAEVLGSVSTIYSLQDWVSIDLTAQVRQWVSGSENNDGLVAIGPEGPSYPNDVYRVFASSDSTHRPELEVHYQPALPPVLDVWPGDLDVRAAQTQVTTTARLDISSVTTGALDWTATQIGGSTWLTPSKLSGSASALSPDSLILTLSPSSLALGTHTEQVRIDSPTPGVAGSPLTVTVNLEVTDFASYVYLPMVIGGAGDGSPNVAALVIGIGDYYYLGPAPTSGVLPDKWGYDLPGPPKDFADVVSFLVAMGVSPGRIIQRSESAASRANVVSAFEELDAQEDRDTTVVIYYSGHGGQVLDTNGDEGDGADEFIAMWDTNEGGPLGFTMVLTDDDLQALLANLESRCIVVIIDSCYSGGMIASALRPAGDVQNLRRGLANPLISGPVLDQDAMADLAGPGRLIVTGATGDQNTWESSELENGVFTYYFFGGLQDAANDADGDGILSFEEAYWYTRDLVDLWVVDHITPTIEDPDPHQNPDISDRIFGQVSWTCCP